MSLSSRARAVSTLTVLSYQTALNLVRSLGDRPKRLAENSGWSLKVCDQYLLGLEGASPGMLRQCACPDCERPFFVLKDDHRYFPSCPWCDERGQYPAKVVRSGSEWEALSTMYPGETSSGPTRTLAVRRLRELEVSLAGGDFEDHGAFREEIDY